MAREDLDRNAPSCRRVSRLVASTLVRPGLDCSACSQCEQCVADGAALAFGSRTIRFVPARDGRTGIVALDVHATDRDHVAGSAGELCNTMIRFV